MSMVSVPKKFQISKGYVYPPQNIELFEEYFYRHFIPIDGVVYLPIFWTSLMCLRKAHNDYSDVQEFLNGLDRSKKYFTIVQHDDNIPNDLSHLNIVVFAAGGYGKHRERVYPVPLLCQSLSDYTQSYPKSVFASFMGAIKGRHPIREKMREVLKDDSDYCIEECLMSDDTYPRFIQTMRSSTFSLCPRGYGATSYRICEALQNDSIPVYIYDDPIIPFSDTVPFETYGILLPEREISTIREVLSSKTAEDIENYRRNGKRVYERYFTYVGCRQAIFNWLTGK